MHACKPTPEHTKQFLCSFHGGMQAVTYQWGAYNHQGAEARSPDELALSSISHAMADWAGKFPIRKYPVDRYETPQLRCFNCGHK